MRDFPARPKGTLILGRFRSSTEAERALRVLKNAGYARAEVASDSEPLPGTPILLVVDAAATGAFRAAEILEEHGADVTYDSEPPVAPRAEPTSTPPAGGAFVMPPLPERKPRVRKRTRRDVVIITRGIESVAH